MEDGDDEDDEDDDLIEREEVEGGAGMLGKRWGGERAWLGLDSGVVGGALEEAGNLDYPELGLGTWTTECVGVAGGLDSCGESTGRQGRPHS